MEIRILKYFLMAAREENITKAASLLHITQPTLSRQLMQLEEELGVTLFTRSNHRIILTDDGMLLKRRAQELVSLAEKTKMEFLHDENTLAGEIAIGCGETRSMNRLAELMADFRSRYPLVRFEIYSGNVDNIKERMERGLLDLGLFVEPVDVGKYEFLRMPVKETWGILVREDSHLAEMDAVRAEDLVRMPLLAASREMVQNELANWFWDYACQMEIAVTYNLVYNASIMVKKGIGAALCLELDSSYDGVKFVPLSPQLKIGSVLAWKRNQMFSSSTSAFIRYARSSL